MRGRGISILFKLTFLEAKKVMVVPGEWSILHSKVSLDGKVKGAVPIINKVVAAVPGLRLST